jgi:ABC-type transport system substrate-binding protein
MKIIAHGSACAIRATGSPTTAPAQHTVSYRLLARAQLAASLLLNAHIRANMGWAPTAGHSAGYTNSMLKRLIYTTPVLWGTKSRPDGSLTYDPDTIEGRLVIAHKVSEDRQTIEFTLRPNAKFANGDPIDARALKDS